MRHRGIVRVSLVIGTCKLCGRTGQRLVDSHIIPKGLYEGLVDAAGHPARLIHDHVHPRRIKKGLFDQFLCAACEARFGSWDQHIQEALRAANLEELFDDQGSVKGWRVQKFNYEKAQMFFVALAWRIHAASRDPFAMLSLSPRQAQIASDAIRAGEVGDASCFNVVLSRFDHDASIAFLDPVEVAYSGIPYWRVAFPRFSAEIKTDSAPAPPLFEALSLKPDQPWYLIKRDFENSQEVQIMKTMLKAQGLLP